MDWRLAKIILIRPYNPCNFTHPTGHVKKRGPKQTKTKPKRHRFLLLPKIFEFSRKERKSTIWFPMFNEAAFYMGPGYSAHANKPSLSVVITRAERISE